LFQARSRPSVKRAATGQITSEEPSVRRSGTVRAKNRLQESNLQMNPSSSVEAQWLAALPARERVRFLASLAHGLTVGQRVLCYDANVEAARQLNEATHQIAGLLVDYFDGRARPQFELFLFGLSDEQALIQGRQAWNDAKNHLGV